MFTRYILQRSGLFLLTLLLSSMMIFFITQYLPGDVARIILGREAGEAALEQLRQELGLHNPVPIQYLHWAFRFLQGDWGRSYSTQSEILPIVIIRLRNSLLLTFLTLGIAIPMGVGLGVIAGLNENKLFDHVINLFSLSVVGLPEFISGTILIELFAFKFNLLPANSSISSTSNLFQIFSALILPALTETLVLLAYYARLTRAGIITEIKLSYVRTALLKGLPYPTVILKHVLRNALLPVITVIAMSFGWLMGGLVVTENVFNYPGLGRLLVFAIDRRDLPLIQAISLITVAGFALANLCADLGYKILNPKVRLVERI